VKIGTKSVLFGIHCFAIHPWFVALAWWKLYGFPLDPRIWVAFFVHDLGYIGKPNMDGPEGEEHPILGARIMTWLFDREATQMFSDNCGRSFCLGGWGRFSLLHSRYFAKSIGRGHSRLCVADKLAFCLTPRWLYLPMAKATGELTEYMKNAQKADSAHWKPTGDDARVWHAALNDYMSRWVDEHKDLRADTWIRGDRHPSQPRQKGITS
jgi:hypothetical protein